MDDASLMNEILNRPEANTREQAIGALENLTEKIRETTLSSARMRGLYAEQYHAEEGGTDINEAREVQRLIQQRQEEANRSVQHARAMALFIQRNKQQLGFHFL